MKKNVAVVGYDNFNEKYLLETIRDAEEICFVPVLDRNETAIQKQSYPFAERLQLGLQRLNGISGGVEGIITFWDFPSSALTPFLARDANLRYASVESVIKCEHKVWSREEQAAVVDTPKFAPFYPFDDDPLGDVTLDFPFWVKPAVGHSSILGFEIRNVEEFQDALEKIRSSIRTHTTPFRYVMENVDLPDRLAEKGASLCIAEEIISHGDQVTLEGYVQDGEIFVYGVVDSLRLENEHSFSRYQYPSALDEQTIARMKEKTAKIMRRFGYDNCPFNIEFFHDDSTGRIDVVEVNSRVSQSHADLFYKVDGQSNFQIPVDLALGRSPRWDSGMGEFAVAAKFFIRIFENGRSTSVPDAASLGALERAMPDVRVDVKIAPGQLLADLPEQESYSYEIADVFVGGRDEKELIEKFEASKDFLHFEFQPAGTSAKGIRP
ncbi:MAG: ATP-grasp domain-containing protein [Alphaproteobacteria bacterium]